MERKMKIRNLMAAILASAPCLPAVADAARDTPEYRYYCRVIHSEETSEGAAHSGWGDARARNYRIAVRDGAARATAEIWGVRYTTGWMRESAGGDPFAIRYSGTAGGRRILWPLEMSVSFRLVSPEAASGTVTTFQANGGITVVDEVECSGHEVPTPRKLPPYA